VHRVPVAKKVGLSDKTVAKAQGARLKASRILAILRGSFGVAGSYWKDMGRKKLGLLG
jgi:hypothetical protein